MKRTQKYDRTIIGKCGTAVVVDVYRLLDAFGVTDQAVGHAIKKLLCAGIRNGGKPPAQDIDEAIWTLQEQQQLEQQKATLTNTNNSLP